MSPPLRSLRSRFAFRKLPLVVALGLALARCGQDILTATAPPNRTLSATVGQEIQLTLQTIGPGGYQNPPTISSPAVRFLDVAVIGTPPAGATLRYRFMAAARGQATILFQYTDPSFPTRTIEDTVIVQ
jgi:hypothetical protein